MLSFNVSTSNFLNFEKATLNDAKKILFECMFKMEELAVRQAPVDMGDLKKGIDLRPKGLSDEYVLVSKVDYSEAMEYGTGPMWVDLEPLKEWAGRKLGDESLGFAVQKKIAEKGVNAHPFMRPALFEVQNYWFPFYANRMAKK